MLKDILFALELGFQVIGVFIICSFIGVKLDEYLGTQPIMILMFLLFAFAYVIKLLLGVGKHE